MINKKSHADLKPKFYLVTGKQLGNNFYAFYNQLSPKLNINIHQYISVYNPQIGIPTIIKYKKL